MTPEKIAEIEKRVRVLSIETFTNAIRQADKATKDLQDRIKGINRLLVQQQTDHDQWMTALRVERDEIVAALTGAGKGLVALDPTRCPVVGTGYEQCTREPHADPLKTGLLDDHHRFDDQ